VDFSAIYFALVPNPKANVMIQISQGGEVDVQKVVETVMSTFKLTDSTSTADWKTYSYTQLGYSFKLPNSYSVSANQQAPNETSMLQNLNVYSEAKTDPSEAIISVQTAASLADGIKKLEQGDVLLNEKKLTVNNLEWTSFDVGRAGGSEMTYLIYANNRLYTVDGADSAFIKQILSTYKFTK
jgi:hypothetical protein